MNAPVKITQASEPVPMRASDLHFFMSVFDGLTDMNPELLEGTWAEGIAYLMSEKNFRTREDKKKDPCWGFNLARFVERGGTIRRSNAHVEALSGVTLDFDEGYNPAALFDTLELMGIVFHADTTFSHTPQTPKWRLLVPTSRLIMPHEYEAIRAALHLQLTGKPPSPKEGADEKAKDPSHFFFAPSCPAANVGYRDRRDSDENAVVWVPPAVATLPAKQRLLSTPPSSTNASASVSTSAEGYTKFDKAWINAKMKTYGKDPELRKAFNALIKGESFAEHGSRDTIITRMTGALAGWAPNGDPELLAKMFEPSIEKMTAEMPDDPPPDLENIAHKIDRAQVKLAAKDEAARVDEGASAGDVDNDAVILNPQAPLENARALLRARFERDGHRIVHHHGGQLFVWEGARYKARGVQAIENEIYEYLEGTLSWKGKGDAKRLGPFNPERAHVGNVMHALSAVTNQEDGSEPRWLQPQPGDLPATELLACANGLLHLPTRQLLPHSPRFFNLAAVPYAFDPSAKASKMPKFLNEIFPGDQESIDTLQELCGYFLTPDVRLHKIAMFIGKPRSGKGTVGRVLQKLLGDDNVVTPSLSGLGTNFGLAPFIGKRLAFVPDARFPKRSDQQVMLAERLVSISGEDAQTIDRKNKDVWTGTLTTRFLLSSNDVPKIKDVSGALAERFLLLNFQQSFAANPNRNLTNELLAELPAILNWALDGLDRLRARGDFIQPKSAAATKAALQEATSAVTGFVRERCNLDPSKSTKRKDVFDAWNAFCVANGIDEHGSMSDFSNELYSAFGIEWKQETKGQLRGDRVYTGIELRRAQPRNFALVTATQDKEVADA